MAKNIAASRQKKPSGLSDKVSDIVLVVICAAIMLIVAYPLYYVLVAVSYTHLTLPTKA